MSSAPQGFILELVLFYIFFVDKDSGIECSLGMVSKEAKLGGAARGKETPGQAEGKERCGQTHWKKRETWTGLNVGPCKIHVKTHVQGPAHGLRQFPPPIEAGQRKD